MKSLALAAVVAVALGSVVEVAAFELLLLGLLAALALVRGRGPVARAALVLLLFAIVSWRSHSRRAVAEQWLSANDGEAARWLELRLEGFPTVQPDGDRMLACQASGVPGARGWLRLGGSRAALADDWLPGERIAVFGAVQRLPADGPLAEWEPPRFAVQSKSARLAERIEPAGWALELNGVIEARLAATARRSAATASGIELARSVLLGRAGGVDASTRSVYRRTGLAHFLAVSGLQVALLAWLVDRGQRALGAPLWLRVLVGVSVSAGYAAFCGGGAPVMRAAVMVALIHLARLFERPATGGAFLAAAMVLELLLRPEQLFAASFQLTYAACWGLRAAAGGYGPIAAARATLGAELATVPVSLLHFAAVPAYGLLTNLLAVPILLVLGAACSFAALLHRTSPDVADAVLFVGGSAAEQVEALLRIVAGWPGAMLWAFGGAAVSASLGALAMLLGRRRWSLAAVGALGLLGGFGWAARPGCVDAGELVVTALDVGQGSATLVRADGRSLLFDGGGRAGVDRAAWADRVLLRQLAQRGVFRVDVAALSHPHPDHCLGLVELVGRGLADELWLPRAPDTGGCLRDLRSAAAESGIPVRVLAAGDGIRYPRLTVAALAPERRRVSYAGDATNEWSLVLRVEAQGRAALLAGDIGRWTERQLVRSAGLQPVDLLMVPHHGSRTSSSTEFLARLQPRAALLSVGRRNPFGHPAAEVLARYRRQGIVLMRTDVDGWVELGWAPGRSTRLATEAGQLD